MERRSKQQQRHHDVLSWGVDTYSDKESEEEEAGDKNDQDGSRRELDLGLVVTANGTMSQLQAAAGQVNGERGHFKDPGRAR
jgi:hypothetical protein